ncbi:MAG: DNA primase [Gemmobacter sp.]|uniref:DNA primase n=1 Tax=Gemmobacter sp. TaxID=1898957 RepID=UPI00391AED1A
MSLPPGFLDELRNRLSLAQVVGRKVVWDMRKSNQGKGDMWAPCPFHQEKSASFHVDDRKGYYYCFGCHAKGDAISFVKETENVGFMEAVEILAREAAMPMPARDPAAVQVADRRTKLAEVMEAAVQHYRLMLRGSAGALARDYLARRRLAEAAQDRWHIGWAPEARAGLVQALGAKGIGADLLVEAGLAIRPDDGGAPYDRFRGRVIFPIRDARGRAISLGGRALDPNARAKYLNGPETALFDKGRSLFNHGPAREAAGKGQRLIVAEGYMDVIALSEAGFTGAVAPLGTAVTAEQLQMLWRMHDEPVIALDGDAAGIRAALRVIDLALPLLEAGKGLRFAVLPGGMDPDDLIKAEGPGGFQRVLDGAQPMVRLLWQRETEGQVFDSPERRAALDKRLRAVLARIADPTIRTHYGTELKSLREGLFGTGVRAPRGFVPTARGAAGKLRAATQPPSPSARASLLAVSGAPVEDTLREAVVLAVLALHPALIDEFDAPLQRLECQSPAHAAVRAALLRAAHTPEPAAQVQALAGEALDLLRNDPHVRLCPASRKPADADLARLCLAEEFAKLEARRAARREIADGEREIEGSADEGLTWRVSKAAEAVNRPLGSAQETKPESVVAENGVELARDDLDYSARVFGAIDFTRGGRSR